MAHPDLQPPWGELVGQAVVLDLASPFVYVGRLAGQQGEYLLLEDADAHDLRDTSTTRERYVQDTREHGIRANRRRVWVALREVVGVSALSDVLDA